MKFQPFVMERWQSTWENRVEYNLAESGVHPLQLEEVLNGDTAGLTSQSLGYPQTNGTEELRKAIAAMYSKTGPDDILVTNGSSEANFVTFWSFLRRGGEVVVILPNYMQIWGLAKTMRVQVKSSWLLEDEAHWYADLRALSKIVSKKTKLIAVCNPNNPTGAVMDEETMDEICEIAKRTGAWILSDEVYQGAELDGKETPTFWGRYDGVIVTNGLSKAYGLPGLRIGWAVAGKELASKLWSYHDYTTICPTVLSDFIARKVLQPCTRARILGRTRTILQTNLPILKEWIKNHGDCLSFTPPKAGAIAYLKYSLKINSTKLAERLLREKSTLIVPGDHFGMDHYIRIGYGSTQGHLMTGLGRIGELISTLGK